jgi:AmmeMemoRadiSam system protein B
MAHAGYLTSDISSLASYVEMVKTGSNKARGMGTARIRSPAGAGLFYPRSPQKLRADVERLLADAPAPAGGEVNAIKAVIAPHAGYVYSGAIAAVAFASLGKRARHIERVVVIGPAHYVALRGIAIPDCELFETPLGEVSVDRDALSAIADLPWVVTHNAAHAPEHALEVELPFLQNAIGQFQFVPLLVGNADAEQVGQTLGCLWGGDETLIVISSDLSHYHEYDAAKRLDAATAGLIERGEWGELRSANACGYLPIAGFLIEAAQRGLGPKRLAMCNSGDTAGDRHSVVGYGAWAFAGGRWGEVR